ncbi:MAG: hypothetical protein EZS28_018375 [Streblomastix strix]|uniref:COMM domain-containing protein n=1 Tax=Streblomastix strix TaxID=222440 RepID=A0A5J4VTU3_9EUKA|nr:MAG: hypothetical protein EZS28_018375 [Streblomastix strix]
MSVVQLGNFLSFSDSSSRDILLDACFKFRESQSLPQEIAEELRQYSHLSIVELNELLIYNAISDEQKIKELLTGCPPQLVKEFSKHMSVKVAQWLDYTIESQLSIPKFRGLEWKTNLKADCNSSISDSFVPTAMVNLQVENPIDSSKTDVIEFEMEKDTLNDILQGLGQIREQLQAIAQQQK